MYTKEVMYTGFMVGDGGPTRFGMVIDPGVTSTHSRARGGFNIASRRTPLRNMLGAYTCLEWGNNKMHCWNWVDYILIMLPFHL